MTKPIVKVLNAEILRSQAGAAPGTKDVERGNKVSFGFRDAEPSADNSIHDAGSTKPEAWLFTTQRAALDALFLLWSDPRDKTWTVNTRTLSAKSYVGGGREIRCFIVINETLPEAVQGQEFSKVVFHGLFPDHVVEAAKTRVR